MAAKLTGMAWLRTQITKIETTKSQFKTQIEQIMKIKPEVYNEFREWTPLKLILLNYTLDVCTPIIANMLKRDSFFKEMYFVDLFAGSGINRVKDTKDFIIGSPLIAALNYGKTYSGMYFCDSNTNYSEALDLRMATLNNTKLYVKKGSYDQFLPEIISKVNQSGVYSLFFIDPHSTEFSWDSMKQVLEIRSDILFNFMTSEIARTWGLAKAGKGGDETLNNVFGDDSWRLAESTEDLVSIYAVNILKARPNAIFNIVKVRAAKFNFRYDLFFITNQTKGENQWMRAIEKAKQEIERNSDESVKVALDLVKGRMKDLFSF
ncbi:MAG TPA: three-Cys-motif partner protein TcmP [Nanoarchaeota archaeon]|nr:three-Cys-motif partner protein TcmP [Nanoarchaeota archaeon]